MHKTSPVQHFKIHEPPLCGSYISILLTSDRGFQGRGAAITECKVALPLQMSKRQHMLANIIYTRSFNHIKLTTVGRIDTPVSCIKLMAPYMLHNSLIMVPRPRIDGMEEGRNVLQNLLVQEESERSSLERIS